MTDYVFGYGSLLERASRMRTNPDAVGAWPARVTGYSRGWITSLQTTSAALAPFSERWKTKARL